MLTSEIAHSAGVKLIRVPTGEIHVTEKMEELKSQIGGEGNGGVILPEINKCRDAAVGIALILDLLVNSKKSIAEIYATFPHYFLIKEKIPAAKLDFAQFSDKLLFEFKNALVDNQDGIRLDFKDSWLLIRQSNTEPIVRVFAEAKDQDKAQSLIDKVLNIIRSLN